MPASRIALVALVLALPLAAAAQPRVQVLVGGRDAGFANAGQCGDTETVTYSITAGIAACSDFHVWATAGSSCGGAPDAGDYTIGRVLQANVITQPTGSMSFVVQNLPIIDGGCGQAIDQPYQLCGGYQYNGSGLGCSTNSPYSTMPTQTSYRYDALPPGAPTLGAVTPLDQQLRLDVAVADDTAEVQLEFRERTDAGSGGWSQSARIAVGQPYRLENLVNDTDYEVRARGFDGADNVSDYSGSVVGRPQELLGFFDAYKAAGGHETGGCSAGGLGGGLWVMFFVPALLGLWRRLR